MSLSHHHLQLLCGLILPPLNNVNANGQLGVSEGASAFPLSQTFYKKQQLPACAEEEITVRFSAPESGSQEELLFLHC